MDDDILDDIDFNDSPKGGLEEEMEYYMELFMQRRADIYIDIWKRGAWLQINLLHMLVGVPWLLYRRMYALAGMLLFLPWWLGNSGNLSYSVPALGIVDVIIHYVKTSQLGANLVMLLVVMIVCGILGNSLYIAHVRGRIGLLYARHKHDRSRLMELLERKGGVNGVLLVLLLMFVLMRFLDSQGTGMNTILTF